MLLAYIDESGNTGARLDDLDQPIHWMVAVVVPEDQVRPLTFALDGVITSVGGRSIGVELHGADLFGGERDWKGVPPSTRINVYKEALGLLAAHGCRVAHASIDKQRLAGSSSMGTSPHVMAFQFLAEKLDAYTASRTEALEQRVMLIADETEEHGAFQIDLITQMQRGQAGIGSGRTLTRTVDTVHFVDSCKNRGVQLADLVAYAMNRSNRKRGKADLKPGDLALIDMIDRYVTPCIATWRQTWPG